MIRKTLEPLKNLLSFELSATGDNDLIDGECWENFLSTRSIEKFDFHLSLSPRFRSDFDLTNFIEKFRSKFWLKEKRWFVVCEKWRLHSSQPTVYSIPRFQSETLVLPSDSTHRISTSEKQNRSTRNLIIASERNLTIPDEKILAVRSLNLFTSTLLNVSMLQSILNLNNVQQLDISSVGRVTTTRLDNLIDHLPNLKQIHMCFEPLFTPPLRVEAFRFSANDEQIFVLDSSNIDRFCFLYFHLTHLEVSVQSQDILAHLINRLHYLEMVSVFCYEDSLFDVNFRWFERNVPRLKSLRFSYRVMPNFLMLSIGDRKVKH